MMLELTKVTFIVSCTIFLFCYAMMLSSFHQRHPTNSSWKALCYAGAACTQSMKIFHSSFFSSLDRLYYNLVGYIFLFLLFCVQLFCFRRLQQGVYAWLLFGLKRTSRRASRQASENLVERNWHHHHLDLRGTDADTLLNSSITLLYTIGSSSISLPSFLKIYFLIRLGKFSSSLPDALWAVLVCSNCLCLKLVLRLRFVEMAGAHCSMSKTN